MAVVQALQEACSSKFPEDSTVNETSPSIKKKMKHIIVIKSRRGAIFRPTFKNEESVPKLVYLAYKFDSNTVAFFSDLYHTFESKSRNIFDINLPGEREKYMNPPLYCKGLFAFPAVNYVLVCNPAAKEAITLPKSSKHIPRPEMMESEGINMRVGFGFLHSTHAYKVVQFFYRSYDLKEERYSMGFEVFTIGVSSSWRVLAKDPPYPIRNSCSTFSGKCVYFYIWDALDPHAPNAFLSFNLKNDKFSLLHPPRSLDHIYIVNMRLADLRGGLCLSVLLTNSTKIGVFINKHGTRHDWTPVFCLSLVLQSEEVLVRPIVEYKGKILIHVNQGKQWLELYDTKDESVQEVGGEVEDLEMEKEGFRPFKKKPWFYVSSYQESLIKLNSECKI